MKGRREGSPTPGSRQTHPAPVRPPRRWCWRSSPTRLLPLPLSQPPAQRPSQHSHARRVQRRERELEQRRAPAAHTSSRSTTAAQVGRVLQVERMGGGGEVLVVCRGTGGLTGGLKKGGMAWLGECGRNRRGSPRRTPPPCSLRPGPCSRAWWPSGRQTPARG